MADDNINDDTFRRHITELAAPTPTPVEAARDDVIARIARRRTKRQFLFGVCTLIATVGALALASRPGDDDPQADRGAQSEFVPLTTTSSADALPTLLAIEARNGPAGTERVILVFDSPLPVATTDIRADIATTDATVSFSVRRSSELFDPCGSAPSRLDPDGLLTSVDVRIPAQWLDPATGGKQPSIVPDPAGSEHFDGLAKVIVCRPNSGVVQIAIFDPATTDSSDINLTVDRARIIVDIGSHL